MSPSNKPPRQSELPLPTPRTASLALTAAVAMIAWLAIAAQTDITVARMSSYLRISPAVDGAVLHLHRHVRIVAHHASAGRP